MSCVILASVVLNVVVLIVVILIVVVPNVIAPIAVVLNVVVPFCFNEMAWQMQSVFVTSIVSRQKKREKRKREREIHKQFCLSGSCPSFLTLSQMHSLKVHQKHSLSLSLSLSRFITQTTG